MIPPPVTIAATEVHTIVSEYVEDTFCVWIAPPRPDVRGDVGPPPRVLYVLDANLFFGTVVESTRLMHELYGELPPLLVVGIAYATDDPRLQAELRARDFTPTRDAGMEAMARESIPNYEPTLPEDRRLGGASRFLRCLTDEIVPFVEAHYDVAPGARTLFGSSLGGSFALYAMLTAPDAFDQYVAASPAIWWDDGVLFRLEEEYAAGASDLDARLFLAVGALEENDRMPWMARFKMVTNVRTMAERLDARGYPSLAVTTTVFEDESHTSVVPVAMTRGLRTLLARR